MPEQAQSQHSLSRKFSELFGVSSEQAQIWFSPGRLCLIGEHIDYNGGFVLPAAISLGIFGVFRKNSSSILKMRTGLNDHEVRLDLREEIVFSGKRGWGNYPAGVVKYLQQRGLTIPGGELLFESTLPVGAGLSSSAAIEALTGFILFSEAENDRLNKIELARLCQKAENNFVGVKCGIMDQFAVILGRKNHALLLDCDSLAFEHVPVESQEYSLVIFNTNKKRELTDSLFNTRVRECEEALRAIQKERKIGNLAHAHEEEVMELVSDPTSRKRALHVVQENKRVKEATAALKAGDIQKFGSLLFKSHASLRTQYEVTGYELDAIEEAARSHPACIGAKMSGAGFGGCAFAIARKEFIEEFSEYVTNVYKTKTGLKAACHFAEIVDGVRKLI